MSRYTTKKRKISNEPVYTSCKNKHWCVMIRVSFCLLLYSASISFALIASVNLLLFDMYQFESFETFIGVVLIVFCCLGIIGNILTLNAYPPENANRAVYLVLSLAVFDLVFLICALFLLGIPLTSKKFNESDFLVKLLPLM